MLRDMFRTKSLEQLQAGAAGPREAGAAPQGPGGGLKRRLTAFDLALFGVGAIIGAGIFSTIGTAAAGNAMDGRLAAGPGLAVSIVVVAVACLFTALAYAEMSSMIPVAGSAYTYAYATMGELAAWVIGWDLLLEYAVSNVAVAISWGDYARSFLANVLHVHIPGWLAMDPRTALALGEGASMPLSAKLDALAAARAGGPESAMFANWDTLRDAPTLLGFPVTFNLLAVLVTVAITYLVYRGIKESSRANNVMVILKVVILLLVIGAGARFIAGENYAPFFPNGWRGVQAGAAIIFFAFIGFDSVSTTAEECRNPARDLPRGILWSLGICAAVYVLIALVVTGMLKYTQLEGVADPLAYIFEQKGLSALAGVISAGAVVATTAALLVFQVGQPRIFMAMGRDGLLGPWFGRVSPKRGTPANATLLAGIMVAVPAAFLNIGEVVELTNIGTLFAFSLVCVGVVILRVRRPDAPRGFKMPLYWLAAPLGVLACAWLALGLPRLTWQRFAVWLLAGLAVYAIYGRRNSRLRGGGTMAGGGARNA
jgi:APA family basic amino acid/polyamine antiporter